MSDNDTGSATADAPPARHLSADAVADAETPSSIRRGSLSSNPVAIRNARLRGEATGVAGIPTSPSRIDEESDIDAGEEGESRSGAEAAGDGDETVVQETEVQETEVRYQIMTSLLPDLRRATHELKHRLDNGNHGHEVFAVILKMKRIAFRALLEAYNEPVGSQSPSPSPLIDYSWLEPFAARNEFETRSLVRASTQANQVSVLDSIQQVNGFSGGGTADVLSFLQALDAAFPRLFAPPGSSTRPFCLALAVRTQLFIESLAAAFQAGEVNVAAVLASVFCADKDMDADQVKLVASGPFRSIAGIDDIHEGGQEWIQISQRVQELTAVTSGDNQEQAVVELRQEHPLGSLLDHVRKWCLEQYALLVEAEAAINSSSNEPVNAEADDFQDAQESVPDSQTDTQASIIRRPAGYEKRQSLLDRDSSAAHQLQALRPVSRPSYGPPSEAPSDYDIGTASLLGSEAGHPVRSLRVKRPRPPEDDELDEDSETGAFQTDTRQDHHHPDQVRAKLKHHVLPGHQPPAAISSMPPPPQPAFPPTARFPYPSSAPLPPRPNLENIRARRTHTVQRARPISRLYTPSFVKRYPWSDNDSALLVELVAEERAKWAAIERNHNHRFETPRNQQAYRDKARSMKVDFLLADAVLPPCFDLVILGKKEMDKVLAGRRNPHRREDDRDEEGNPVNTRVG